LAPKEEERRRPEWKLHRERRVRRVDDEQVSKDLENSQYHLIDRGGPGKGRKKKGGRTKGTAAARGEKYQKKANVAVAAPVECRDMSKIAQHKKKISKGEEE